LRLDNSTGLRFKSFRALRRLYSKTSWDCLILNILRSFEMSVTVYQSTLRNISEVLNLQTVRT